MATETQRHRVSKTLTVSAGRNEMFQGAHDVIVRRDDAASSVEHRGNNRARRVLFARSRFLCASVPLWPLVGRYLSMVRHRGATALVPPPYRWTYARQRSTWSPPLTIGLGIAEALDDLALTPVFATRLNKQASPLSIVEEAAGIFHHDSVDVLIGGAQLF